jgi:type IV pilus assembly protein PilO
MEIDIKHVNEWSLKKQSIIFVLIFIIVFIMGYKFDIYSLQDDLEAAKKNKNELLRKINVTLEKQHILKMDIDQLPRYQQALLQWEKKLVPPEKLSGLLNEILKMSNDNHLYIAAFNPGEKKYNNTYPMVPINVVALGTYHQLGNFLGQIANYPLTISIGDFTLTTEAKTELLGKKLTEEASTQDLVTGIFNFQIYFPKANANEKK